MIESIRSISLRGARQHNLQGIDLDFAIGQLTVLCGVSGSGKTSLALNTLYAEGQRRYIESFSAYTRQFLQRIEKPSFDSLVNLPPSVAITREQRGRNNRSTVGTASEMLEYLRVWFANQAELVCYSCGRRIQHHNPKTVCDVLRNLDSRRALLCFEIQWKSKSELSEVLFDLQTSGFVRLIANGQTVHLADGDRKDLVTQFEKLHHAYVVVDRLMVGAGQDASRVLQSLATVFEHTDDSGSQGAIVFVASDGLDASKENKTSEAEEVAELDGVPYEVHRFSTSLRCQYCKIDFPESEPRLFNFNNPIGACSACEGFGGVVDIDMRKVVPDQTLSLNQGAIAVWRTPSYSHELDELRALSSDFGIPMDTPVSKLTKKQWKVIQHGVPERNFGGLDGFFAWLESKKYKMHIRVFLSRWRTYSLCQACNGKRLNQGAMAYLFHDKSFAELCEITIDELVVLIERANDAYSATRPSSVRDVGRDRDGVGDIKADENSAEDNTSGFLVAGEARARYVAAEPLRQVLSRLGYLKSVGLGYLSLSRPLHTLSGGEAQRVMMTTLLGSSLVDMLYVFDEPTVGLHPQDTDRMAKAILGLRDRGNTVVLVEHEPHLMQIADRIVEIGPQAGELGGRVIFNGTPAELLQSDSLTGQYLSGRSKAERQFRAVGPDWIGIQGASGRNLSVDKLRIPLNCLTVVIGPSGSGKSSLILETLCPALERHFEDSIEPGLPFESLFGVEHIQGCLAIDQSPIPRSSRSSPVTYCKAFDDIRQAYAETPDAKSMRLDASCFSFNSERGRCPTCEGLGFTTVDMQFMADIQLPCPDCDGKRFRSEVLQVRLRDLSIAEVLQMSVERAQGFFRGNAKVQDKLKPLIEIGLGYLPLGQSISSLSAGESMRLKLASHLSFGRRGLPSERPKGKLIVLDEPTTGLHFSDVERLLQCIDVLIDAGNSVLVIEHNQQVISAARPLDRNWARSRITGRPHHC